MEKRNFMTSRRTPSDIREGELSFYADDILDRSLDKNASADLISYSEADEDGDDDSDTEKPSR